VDRTGVLPSALDHPAWRVAAGTAVAYSLLLGGVVLVLFVLPYLLFLAV
jgi:hypothetical protein